MSHAVMILGAAAIEKRLGDLTKLSHQVENYKGATKVALVAFCLALVGSTFTIYLDIHNKVLSSLVVPTTGGGNLNDPRNIYGLLINLAAAFTGFAALRSWWARIACSLAIGVIFLHFLSQVLYNLQLGF